MEDSIQVTKKRVAGLIGKIIKTKGLNHSRAAEMMGIARPRIVKVCHGRLESISMDALLNFLSLLDQEVTIMVKSKLLGKAPKKIRFS